MKFSLILRHYDLKSGPYIAYVFPKDTDVRDYKIELDNIMDRTRIEGFIMKDFEALKSVNYYFEIPSEWSPIKREILLLSIIYDEDVFIFNQDQIFKKCQHFGDILKKDKSLFKAFYNQPKVHYQNHKTKEIIQKSQELDEILDGLCNSFILPAINQ